MDRRNFLKSTGTFIAGATIARSTLATGASEPAQGRLVLPLNRNWRYSRTVAEGAHARHFDDSGYERVGHRLRDGNRGDRCASHQIVPRRASVIIKTQIEG